MGNALLFLQCEEEELLEGTTLLASEYGFSLSERPSGYGWRLRLILTLKCRFDGSRGAG